MQDFVLGTTAMACWIVMLFFFRFWRQTNDRLFLMFAIAFVVDAFMRIILAIAVLPDETEPFFYIGRLLSFSLIVFAIIDKNRGGTSGGR